MIHVTAAIEHHLLDAGGAGAFGNLLSNHLGGGNVVSALQFLARLLVDRAGRGKRAPGAIVDDLRVDVPFERYTQRRGRSGVPVTRVRTRR